jgi:hypothetical protein
MRFPSDVPNVKDAIGKYSLFPMASLRECIRLQSPTTAAL